jgi:hypothetical protein
MGTMEPLDQDSGIHPESKTMLNKETRIGNNLLAEYFNNSLIIRSPPQALLRTRVTLQMQIIIEVYLYSVVLVNCLLVF